MKRDDDITQEEFDELLAWLDPEDPRRAGRKYEHIRSRLIILFVRRQFMDPEDLADKTINRVARKVKELRDKYWGDPARYFFGVAKMVMREVRKSQRKHPRAPLEPLYSMPASHDEDKFEVEYYVEYFKEVVERCLNNLSAEELTLLRTYYLRGKGFDADARVALAKKHNMSLSALRVKIHRIKAKLERNINREMARLRGAYYVPPPNLRRLLAAVSSAPRYATPLLLSSNIWL